MAGTGHGPDDAAWRLPEYPGVNTMSVLSTETSVMRPRVSGPSLWWRTACAAPAVVASVGVLVVATGWMRPWQAALVLLAWLVIGPALGRPAAERLVVRTVLGFRTPRPAELATLQPVVRSALDRCGLHTEDIDVYVHRDETEINACAAGRRSMAVSAGTFRAVESGAMRPGEAAAMLCHEIGHLAAAGSAAALPLAWLGAPWRLIQTAGVGLLRPLIRRVPLHRVSVVLLPVIGVVAAVQLVAHRAWSPLAILVGFGLVIWIQPVAEAALRRAQEYAADRYATAAGVGPQLITTLRRLPAPQRRIGAWARLRAGHPTPAKRIDRLLTEVPQASR